MAKEKNLHNEPKLYWFSKFIDLGNLPFFKQLKLLVNLIFVEVAPEIPINLKKSYTGPDGKHAAIIGFLITFFFAFIVNLGLSAINGTLIDPSKTILENLFTHKDFSPSDTIYFLEDWWNIVLYSFICPIYVGLTCWLIVIVVKKSAELTEFKNLELSENIILPKRSNIKPILLGLLILSVAFLLTSNYINDIMSLVDQKKYYWFLTTDHELRGLGVYYFLLNFSLLIVTLIALTFFMSIYSLVMEIGRTLEKKKNIVGIEFDILKTKLSAFTEAYIVTKGIIAAYIANIWIWADSPLGKGITDNFEIAVILLAVIGIFIVSIPRYFVELQWYNLKLRSNQSSVDIRYEDIRSFTVKNIAHILDWLFIGGFALSAIKYLVGF